MITAFIIIGILLLVICVLCAVIYALDRGHREENIDFNLEDWRNPFL